ncbi:unnamed protein product [Adineta steineri]|uniref:Uncharacterized protein n=1 Tax=Adineta steineri TaxID=433720 RepID=A0A814QVE1_9BILA|nr:unnamed protein product [Adineta steineri]CAF1124932.1 unnamed protein product [Adineta steineri]
MIDKLKDFLDSKLTFYRVEIECDLTTINSVIIASIACHALDYFDKGTKNEEQISVGFNIILLARNYDNQENETVGLNEQV